MIDLFLFDLDGVMVEGCGYLKALQDTVAHFSRQMGVGEHPPTEKEAQIFEANGLTSEWDSGPMCVATLLLERVRLEPTLPLPARWTDAVSLLASRPHPLPQPNYAAVAQRVCEQLQGGTRASHAARAVLWERVQTTPGLKAHQPALAALLESLLRHTHDFYHAPVTHHFQHLAIGSQAIPETYGVAPDFESPAYLRQYDRPLLAHASRERLHEAISTRCLRAVFYTARPSLPPIESCGTPEGASTAKYSPLPLHTRHSERSEESPPLPLQRVFSSPEAEIARSLVGLEQIPIIGQGKVGWLAQQVGENVEHLIKPSPVQALAAVGAACSGGEAAALEAAFAFQRDGTLRPPLADLEAATVHVFEDTTQGIGAVKHAVEALQAAGISIAWQAYGITAASGPKAAAMAMQGIPIFPSVNEAIVAALNAG